MLLLTLNCLLREYLADTKPIIDCYVTCDATRFCSLSFSLPNLDSKWSTPERIAQSGALTLQIKHYGLSTLQVDKKPTKSRRGARTWVQNMILLRSRIHTRINLTNSFTWTMRVHSATKVTGRPATCHPKLKRRTRLYTWERVPGTHQWIHWSVC